MKAVVQRVNYANLSVEGKPISSIKEGYLVLVGYTSMDNEKIVDYIVDRVVGMRIFRDENGKLNKTLADIGGEVLVVSNFTLYGDAFSNRRPDFKKSAPYELALQLYNRTLEQFSSKVQKVASGVFGEHMHIEMSNDGPVTMILENK